MREGKNREVRNVLGHLGLRVNRLIRLSFGPFQLGDLAEGAVEEVRTRVLREQLGERVVALAGADFDAPILLRQEQHAATHHSYPARVARPKDAARGHPEMRTRHASKGDGAQARHQEGTRAPRMRPSRAASRPALDEAHKSRRRDSERFGEPELVRREKRAGRHRRPASARSKERKR
jgi:23S rRNA pseudouridine2605 synthase